MCSTLKMYFTPMHTLWSLLLTCTCGDVEMYDEYPSYISVFTFNQWQRKILQVRGAE